MCGGLLATHLLTSVWQLRSLEKGESFSNRGEVTYMQWTDTTSKAGSPKIGAILTCTCILNYMCMLIEGWWFSYKYTSCHYTDRCSTSRIFVKTLKSWILLQDKCYSHYETCFHLTCMYVTFLSCTKQFAKILFVGVSQVCCLYPSTGENTHEIKWC